MERKKRLTRSRDDAMIAGIAGGIGQYLGIDPTVVRVLFAGLGLFMGWPLLLYVVLWFVMPLPDADTPDRDFAKRKRHVQVPEADDPLHVARPLDDDYEKRKRNAPAKAKRSVDDAEAAADRLRRRVDPSEDAPNGHGS